MIEHDGVIFACAALYPYPEAQTGEMAALTVSPQVQGQGDGERILKRVEQRARAMGLDSIFVLTTRTMHWFIKRGFQIGTPTGCPRRAGARYNWDRRSQVLVKKLFVNRHSPIVLRVAAMARTVQCVYLKRGSRGARFAPYPGRTRQAHLQLDQQGSVAAMAAPRRCWSTKIASISPISVRVSISRARWRTSFSAAGPKQPAGLCPAQRELT